MIQLLFVLAPVLAIMGILVMAGRSARRKGGGNMTTMSLGATYNLLSDDKKKAAKIVVQQNAGAKLEEQSSDGDEALSPRRVTACRDPGNFVSSL